MGRYTVKDIINKHRGKSIAILANGPTSRDENGNILDFSDLYKYCWVINGGWIQHKNATLGFSMHDYRGLRRSAGIKQHDYHVSTISKSKVPTFVPFLYNGAPENMVEFPLKEVMFKGRRAYFAEAVCYMIAFAIYCEVAEIYMHGADYFIVRPEERACVEYWCRAVEDHGIKLNIDVGSTLLKANAHGEIFNVPNFYGYTKEDFPYELEDKGEGRLTIDFAIRNEHAYSDTELYHA